MIDRESKLQSTKIADPNFIALAESWLQGSVETFLNFVWSAYVRMQNDRPEVDQRDLERSITQLLEPRIRNAMTGFEPFYIQHGPFERETMLRPPAQPPAYDLAFVLKANERIMWPLEAKILETPHAVASYIADINEQFMTCRYAPFSKSGAMLGYLLKGTADTAFTAIAKKLACTLYYVPEHARVSHHTRTIPAGKAYPANFSCYHMVLEYPGLVRASSA